MKSIRLLLVTGVSACLSLPVAAGLPPPSISGSYFDYVSGLPDADMRATVVGTSSSFSSVGTFSLFRTSSGAVGGEAQTGITVSLTPSPSIAASSLAEGSGKVPDTVLATPTVGLGGNGASSAGRIDYQFEVTGPAGLVGLNVDGTMGLTISGGGSSSGSANTSLSIFEDFGSGRTILGDGLFGSSNPAPGQGFVTFNRVWYDNAGLLHSEFTADYVHDGYHEHGTYLVQTNQLYTIRLIAATGAIYAASYAGSDGSFAANAFVDPVLSIDAGADPGLYRLLLSEGAGNGLVASVPEPGTSALMIAGLAALGGVASRRRAARL